jgi:hypothetical protein
MNEHDPNTAQAIDPTTSPAQPDAEHPVAARPVPKHGQDVDKPGFLCFFRIRGLVVAVDPRTGGGAMLLVRAGTNLDKPLEGSGVPSWRTDILALFVPEKQLRKLSAKALLPGRSFVEIRGRAQGVARAIEGRLFYVAELVAHSVEEVGDYALDEGFTGNRWPHPEGQPPRAVTTPAAALRTARGPEGA